MSEKTTGRPAPTRGKRIIVKSDFALLDVKNGRAALFKALGFTGRKDGAEPIPITITGRILGAWGESDGTSQEFEIEVDRVEVNE